MTAPAGRSLVAATALGLAALAPVPAAAGGGQAPTVVTVDVDAPIGAVNPKLGGLSWNAGEALDPVEDIRPAAVRIDASLQDASTGPDALDLTRLLGRVAEIRRVGAEPLVILSYMPRWLGEPNAFGRDPTRVAPADLDAWEALIGEVVRTLATAPAPALRFEVWNEPDLPVFWQDSPAAWLDTVERTHRAVAAVAADTGLPIEVGGPATAAPDPFFMTPYAARMASAGLPLDFVSWHYYANHPFFGPDGNEGFVPDAIYDANARRNPEASPRLFGPQADIVRGFIAAPLAGTDLDPALLLTEWNISAAGFDFRHGTHEGAAFVVGTLIELERGGFDGADYYRAISSGDNHPGDWATVLANGSRRPTWWALHAWNETGGAERLTITGDDPASGFWARATRRPDGRVDVFLAAFETERDTARTVAIEPAGCAPPRDPTVAQLSSADSDLRTRRAAPLDPDGRIVVELSTQSAAFVQFACGSAGPTTAGGAPAGGDPPAAEPELPATGDDGRAARLAIVVGFTVLAVRAVRARRRIGF